MKIIITEKQLKEVLGVNLSYLNGNDDGVNKNNYDSEIFTTDKTDNMKTTSTTDKIQKSRTPRSYFGARKRHAVINCSKKNNDDLILETNQDLEDKMYTIPDNIINTLKQNLNNVANMGNISGKQRLENIINMKQINTGEMYRLRNNFNNLEKDSNEYKLLGGDEMHRWIEEQLKNAKSVSHNSKEMKKGLGFENAFIKKHDKASKNGKAHTSKNNNITFSYEN